MACGCWKRECRVCAEVARRAPGLALEIVPVETEEVASNPLKESALWNPWAPKLPGKA